MNASASPLCRAALLALWVTTVSLLAQDLVIQKDNQRREGEVLGVSEGKLRIKIGPAETSLPMEQVASVVKAPPTEYEDALKAWQSGNAEKTLSLLKPVVDTFRGLPDRVGGARQCAFGRRLSLAWPTLRSGSCFC